LRRANKVHPCAAVQNEYSLWTRQPELGLIQTCQELGVAFVPFSPVARGVFGQSDINSATEQKDDFRHNIPRFTEPNWWLNQAAITGFRTYCADMGWAVSAAALAWLLDQGNHLIPIPGTRSSAHLVEWMQAFDISMTPDVRADFARLLLVGFAFGDRYNLEMASAVERYC
jgi:aryl-alcohol dehydrogenase-like predicted oxidoreductase